MPSEQTADSAILVMTTTDSLDLARKIASTLIESRAAGCVHILPQGRSIYRWQEKVCDETEHVLLIKTVWGNFEQVRSRIRRIHSYDVPEIVALDIPCGDAQYLRWLSAECT